MSAKANKPSILKKRDEMAYFRLPKPEMDRLRAIAAADERPVSDIVRRAVRKFLSRQTAA